MLLKENFLLIQAAILEGPLAYDSWELWLKTVDFDHVDMDKYTYKLLPLVYYNLMNQKYHHPLMPRLKGIYRRAWLENQILLNNVIPFLLEFSKNEIPLIVLDDFTSLLQLYDGQGIRQLNSLDILAREQDIPRVLNQLYSNKIWPKVRAGERYLKVETPLKFWSPVDLPLTLAWRLFPYMQTREQADEVWEYAVEKQIGNSHIFTLGIEFQFLRLCQRVVNSKTDLAFFSLVDIAWILSKHVESMDLKRLVGFISHYHLVIQVTECLQMINKTINIPYATELLNECLQLPVSAIDRLEDRWVNSYQPFPDLTARIWRRLLLYRRSPKIPGLFGFFRYFQFAWGGEKLRNLPILAYQHLLNSEHLRGE